MLDSTHTDDVIATVDPALASAAQALAAAEIEAETATRAAREAEDALATVRQRLAEMDAKRRAIGRRRAEGDHRADDGEELATLAADAEALTEMAERRAAGAAAARAAAAQKIRDVDVARFQLARAEDAAAQRLLLPHLETLAGLLLDAIGEANAISARVHNSRPLWAPSRALTDAVRKLDLTRDLVVR